MLLLYALVVAEKYSYRGTWYTPSTSKRNTKYFLRVRVLQQRVCMYDILVHHRSSTELWMFCCLSILHKVLRIIPVILLSVHGTFLLGIFCTRTSTAVLLFSG